ncbi:uncharacterized protein BCR38DRAFT_416200 [Pseudomassariella vexata]|uniref:Uncharacterized protein n=1 Tax=Pseudomassariella vexata TaxID=1141098 RepID=A0A1Y2EIG1_9PEZI|nr:uncharacterized protein BCR38DRAFT_416200 [Pseudomassariella vexata]ORY71227.1 hypothetical protein BCR38DRAFT_416200 [Pseudomassariella vexata]
MFEVVSDAKRVRREDLYDSASEDDISQDEQAEADLRAQLNAQLVGLMDFDFSPSEEIAPAETEAPAEDTEGKRAYAEEPETIFEFRLFRNQEPGQTVLLKRRNVPGEDGADGGFVVPRRPQSYYISDGPDDEAARRFRVTSVSADYILQDAKRRRWGLEKPWRVTSITLKDDRSQRPISKSKNGDDGATDEKRKRPGKKRRIILRTREKEWKEKEEAVKLKLAVKEEHLKDKKKRLNRQKKLKRRAKEREKKLARGEAVSEAGSSRETTPAWRRRETELK